MLNKVLKITAFTGTRADYPRIKSLLSKLDKDKKYDLKIVVTGSHLLKSSGYTIKDIIDDGFKVDKKVKMFLEPLDDSLAGNAQSFARCALGITKIIKSLKPNIALVTVDRVETLAIASVCALMNVPIIHVQGGEISGTIDESIRHAVTKLSHFHFVATKLSKKRVIQMGENPKNVFHTGCPYTDILMEEKKKNKTIKIKNLDIKQRFCIFTMHSVTTNLNEAKILFKDVCEAIKFISEEFLIYAFLPNTDPGCNLILENLKGLKNIFLIKNLKSSEFIYLMKKAEFMIGNSSSGIREAATFKLPVINIGSRQNGREKSTNVVDCGFSKTEILKKVNLVTQNKKFKNKLKYCRNIYGDGKVAQRCLKIIDNLDLKNVIEKKFFNFQR